jgi:preprotein translocase subunit SecA
MLVKLGLKEDEAIVHPWINKALEKAQQKVEARNFDMRKNILKYDDVMNDQRKVVFEQRREMMAQDSLEDMITEMRGGVVDDIVTKYIPRDAYPESWDIEGFATVLDRDLNLRPPLADWQKEEGIGEEEVRERIQKAADESYAARVEKNGADIMRYVEKQVVLQVLDHLWREHLVTLDHLRQVIGWRSLAQRDPLNEYKSEAFELFDGLIANLRETTTAQLTHLEVAFQQPETLAPTQAAFFEPLAGAEGSQIIPGTSSFGGANGAPVLGADDGAAQATLTRNATDPSTWGKVARNEACPCGSGKKYKHCHGALNA